ncbi:MULTISPECIES: EcsC family protein [Peribacillus]|uniref:EcsC family protein n=1 Tax=Peribacillus butanolivorans TaxID=421767 RepID=A0AAX0S683_9BACI|nr:EcsC family protein [Peribacillus butanolivorans]KRF59515.1 ABC transporter substrate-binding protein [Bacillus sp. Soil768D1]AXN37870.1 EcsC family protein [Peribacillus butanolivorans]KON70400.1 ABC transporter substrate-binding protein [Peribacillus butanolivorans]MED3687604.1 EcsC family protein [Peribacillus butanolivorans]PEJ34492.1 EcsC family protein [Peribacillus butanolivorans]
MEFTNREITIWNEISEWQENLYQYEPTDLAALYDKWLEQGFSLLPENVQQQFFEKLDTWLFHLHAMVQSSQVQIDAREQILASARMFNEDIETLSDLNLLTIDQLNYIANQHIAKHRLYSFAQGGISGSGGLLLLGSDIPAMTVINVRTVQLIAMSYGFEVNTPFEMMLALKVFNAGAMPKRLRGTAWEELIREVQTAEDDYFYLGIEELTNPTWMEQPLKQLLKAVSITIFRKKLVRGIPFISMAIGAGSNYQMTRNVSEFAQKFYQYRYLQEKKADEE